MEMAHRERWKAEIAAMRGEGRRIESRDQRSSMPPSLDAWTATFDSALAKKR